MGLFLTRPFDPTYGGIEKVTRVLDWLVERPALTSAPMDAETRRVAYATIFTDPRNVVDEVWREGEFIGLLLLTHIYPQVDAKFHFVFLDRELRNKRRLILSWLDAQVTRLGLQRISVEVPDLVPKLIAFYRHRLGFTFEGEASAKAHPACEILEAGARAGGMPPIPAMPNAHVWVARQGSRKERAHWVPPSERHPHGRWTDVICLRQTADELRARIAEVECPPPSSELSSSLSPPPPLAPS